MKKGLVIFSLILCLLSTLVYAKDLKPALTGRIELTVSGTAGFNLNTSTFGMKSTIDRARLAFDFFGWSGVSTDAADGVYGFVQVNGLNLDLVEKAAEGAGLGVANDIGMANGAELNNWGFQGVVGKVVYQNFFFAVFNQNWFGPLRHTYANRMELTKKVSATMVKGSQWDGGDNMGVQTQLNVNVNNSGLYWFGYSSDMVSVAAKIGTETDWNGKLVNGTMTTGGFNLGLDSTIKPISGLEIGIDVVKAVNYQDATGTSTPAMNPLGAGAAFSYKLPINDQVSVKPYIGADIRYTDVLDMELGGGIVIDWPGSGGYLYDPLLLRSHNYDLDGGTLAGERFAGAALGATYYLPANATQGSLNVFASLFEDHGDAGILPVIGASLSIEGTDLLNASGVESTTLTDPYSVGAANSITSKLAIQLYVDAAIGDDAAVPYFRVRWANFTWDTGWAGGYLGGTPAANSVALDLGCYSKIFPNTKFILEYSSANLMGGTQDGVAATMDKGVVTFKTEISM